MAVEQGAAVQVLAAAKVMGAALRLCRRVSGAAATEATAWASAPFQLPSKAAAASRTAAAGHPRRSGE